MSTRTIHNLTVKRDLMPHSDNTVVLQPMNHWRFDCMLFIVGTNPQEKRLVPTVNDMQSKRQCYESYPCEFSTRSISGGGNERKKFRMRMRTTHNSLKFLHLGRRRTEKIRFDIEFLLNLCKILPKHSSYSQRKMF